MGRERGGEKKNKPSKSNLLEKWKGFVGGGKVWYGFSRACFFSFLFFLYVFWEKIIKYCFFQRFFKTSLGIN